MRLSCLSVGDSHEDAEIEDSSFQSDDDAADFAVDRDSDTENEDDIIYINLGANDENNMNQGNIRQAAVPVTNAIRKQKKRRRSLAAAARTGIYDFVSEDDEDGL